MIIEFIGCSGAGKSTLVTEVLARLHGCKVNTVISDEIVLTQYGLPSGWFRQPLLRSLLMDLLSLPWWIRASFHSLGFWRMVIKVVWRDVELFLLRLNIYRNVAKRLGANWLMRHSARWQHCVVLVDEGLVHQADSLFAHPHKDFDSGEVARFLDLVSLPDVFVHVREDIDVLVARTMQRGHQRLPGRSQNEVEAFIRHAVRLAEVLAQANHGIPVIEVPSGAVSTRLPAAAAEKVVGQLLALRDKPNPKQPISSGPKQAGSSLFTDSSHL